MAWHGTSGHTRTFLWRRPFLEQLVFHFAGELPEQHPEPIGIAPPQRFFDALAVIVEIRDLVRAVHNSDLLRHDAVGLDDANDLVQDRHIHPPGWCSGWNRRDCHDGRWIT